jgi:hypothetical protein
MQYYMLVIYLHRDFSVSYCYQVEDQNIDYAVSSADVKEWVALHHHPQYFFMA